MAALDVLMRVVGEVVNASNAVWSAQARGESWEECTDDRKHYAAVTCALEDMLRNLLDERAQLEGDKIRLEYEATMLMTAMTDVLAHFTRTPSTLADSEVRGMGHAANARMRAALLEMTGNTLYAVNNGTPCRDDGRCQYAIDHGAEGMGHCPEGKCAMSPKEVSG